jgi:hypothetical protein
MTDKQPEALRLADELLFAGRFAYETEDGAARRRIARNFKAAAELRRLHEVNQALLEAAIGVMRFGGMMPEVTDPLRAAISKAEVTK